LASQVQKLNDRVARSTLALQATLRPVADDERQPHTATDSGLHVDTEEAEEHGWSSVLSPRVAALSPGAAAGSPSASIAALQQAMAASSPFGSPSSTAASSPSASSSPAASSSSSSSLGRSIPSIVGLDDSLVDSLVSGEEQLWKYPTKSGLLATKKPEEVTLFLHLVDHHPTTQAESGRNKSNRVSGLYWCKPGTRTMSSSHFIALTDLTSISNGNSSKPFAKLVGKIPAGAGYTASAERCFSIHGKKVALDLEAKSPMQRDIWVKALSSIIGNPQAIYFKFRAEAAQASPPSTAPESTGQWPNASATSSSAHSQAIEVHLQEHSVRVDFNALMEESPDPFEIGEVQKQVDDDDLTSPELPYDSPEAATSSVHSSAPSLFPPLSNAHAQRMLVHASCSSLPETWSSGRRVLVLEESVDGFDWDVTSVSEVVTPNMVREDITTITFHRALGFELQEASSGQLVQFSLYDLPSSLPSGVDESNPIQLATFFNSVNDEDRMEWKVGATMVETDELRTAARYVDENGKEIPAQTGSQPAPLVYELNEDGADADLSSVHEGGASSDHRARPTSKLLRPAHLTLQATTLPPGVSGDALASSSSPSHPASPGGRTASMVGRPSRSSAASSEHEFEVQDFFSPTPTHSVSQDQTQQHSQSIPPQQEGQPAAELAGVHGEDALTASIRQAELMQESAVDAPTATARDVGITSAEAFHLYVSCRNLPDMSASGSAAAATPSSSTHAPLVALFTQSATGPFDYSGHTEVSSGPDPDFLQPITLTLHPDTTGELLKFNVYDSSIPQATISEHDRVGSVLVRWEDILSAESGEELAFALAHEDQAWSERLEQIAAMLIVMWEPMDTANEGGEASHHSDAGTPPDMEDPPLPPPPPPPSGTSAPDSSASQTTHVQQHLKDAAEAEDDSDEMMSGHDPLDDSLMLSGGGDASIHLSLAHRPNQAGQAKLSAPKPESASASGTVPATSSAARSSVAGSMLGGVDEASDDDDDDENEKERGKVPEDKTADADLTADADIDFDFSEQDEEWLSGDKNKQKATVPAPRRAASSNPSRASPSGSPPPVPPPPPATGASASASRPLADDELDSLLTGADDDDDFTLDI